MCRLCLDHIDDVILRETPPAIQSVNLQGNNTYERFRKALIFTHDSVPGAKGFWSRKFGLEIDEHIWSIPSLVTKETRLRVLQWKILHNIYPTNILLCKMKVRDDQMCSYCNDVVDYTEHFFFVRPTIKKI